MLHLSLCHYYFLLIRYNYLLCLIITSKIKSAYQHTAAPYTANSDTGKSVYKPTNRPDQNPKHNEQENSSSKYLYFFNGSLINASIDPYFKIKQRPIHAIV